MKFGSTTEAPGSAMIMNYGDLPASIPGSANNVTPMKEALQRQEMYFQPGKKFSRLVDMTKIPNFEESKDYVFFEPRPDLVPSEKNIEGCLSYTSKIEKMKDKNNLYLCESCTEDKYGKSKLDY